MPVRRRRSGASSAPKRNRTTGRAGDRTIHRRPTSDRVGGPEAETPPPLVTSRSARLATRTHLGPARGAGSVAGLSRSRPSFARESATSGFALAGRRAGARKGEGSPSGSPASRRRRPSPGGVPDGHECAERRGRQRIGRGPRASRTGDAGSWPGAADPAARAGPERGDPGIGLARAAAAGCRERARRPHGRRGKGVVWARAVVTCLALAGSMAASTAASLASRIRRTIGNSTSSGSWSNTWAAFLAFMAS
mgnify:CR=1 FL=1